MPPPPSARESLGCWSTRHETDPIPSRVKSVVDNLGLDIAYTRMSQEARYMVTDPHDDFLDFNHIVPFIFPGHPIHPLHSFPLMEPSPLGHQLPPDEKVSCFDHLYYVTSSRETHEWRFAWSPVWRFVAKHLYFTDTLVDLTRGYLARTFNTRDDNIPPVSQSSLSALFLITIDISLLLCT